MAQVKDILLDENNNYDLLFSDGDFAIGESDQQHVILIINTSLGSWKKSPTCGVGIIKYLCSAGQGQELRRNMTVQLTADGYKVNQILLDENPNGFFDYSIDAIRL